MKQKEEIAEQQETIEQQIDIVNANRLDIAKQRIMVRGNEQKIQEASCDEATVSKCIVKS